MVESDGSRAREIISFGPFRLCIAERLLAKENEPIALGGRSLDLLIALLERPGEVVSRRELMKRVWPDVIVEETNLRVNVANLRKALGDGADGIRYISNVPGRGYSFVVPVRRVARNEFAAASNAAIKSPQLPALLGRMVGRDETVLALRSLITSRRFVSIVGPPGIGKTTVAVATAYALLVDFDGIVCFVDLGAVTDAALVAGTVASAVGCINQAQDPIPSLIALLADRPVLLVLDNCEHVIEAVAALTERLFVEAPLVHLLTTSREALRVEGENVHLLMPLDTPPDQAELTAAQALASPAVQVFMERAVASGYRSKLTDADAAIVAEICRRLDGVALAIELAGSQVGAYGIRGTAELLDHRFTLLWHGRRGAPPRHRTLQATLDWSYSLLLEFEKTILRRLGAFVGNFTLDGALSVVADSDADVPMAAEAVAGLVNKSLVWTSDIGGSTFYRLPDIIRAYAMAKLAGCEEEQPTARRHARYFTNLLKPETIKASVFVDRDISRDAVHLGNVRAALEWCFSDKGDVALGVELSARCAPLFTGLSFLRECERWCERAVAALPEEDRRTPRELALREALAMSSMYTRGNTDEVKSAIERGLNLAETLGDREHQLRLLAWLHIFLTRISDHSAALAIADRSASVARAANEPDGIVMADWMLGVTYHLLGNQVAAEQHCEYGLKLSAASGRVYVDVFGYDHYVRALIILARAQWLSGQPERALTFAHQAIDEAEKRDHPVTVCMSLIYTVQVLLWTGEIEEARARVERLIVCAGKFSLGPFHALGLALKGEVLVAGGEADAGVQVLRGALGRLQSDRQTILTRSSRRALAEGLAHLKAFDDARAEIGEALALAEQDDGKFDMSDLLRARADILLAEPRPDVAAAEASLIGSLEWARKQSALGWELRAATQLARLSARQGYADRARDMLADVYQRFTEGFETADLKMARRLLAELGRKPHDSTH